MEWQPIETAPRDEWLMVLMPEVKAPWHGPRIVFAHWHESEDGVADWCWPQDEADLFTERGRKHAMQQLEDGDLWHSDEPTHWIPLPQPPQGA